MLTYSHSLVNKRGTRFVTARKTIANVNLRGICVYCSGTSLIQQSISNAGLEPVDIRNAQEEFRKFDMENNGQYDVIIIEQSVMMS